MLQLLKWRDDLVIIKIPHSISIGFFTGMILITAFLLYKSAYIIQEFIENSNNYFTHAIHFQFPEKNLTNTTKISDYVGKINNTLKTIKGVQATEVKEIYLSPTLDYIYESCIYLACSEEISIENIRNIFKYHNIDLKEFQAIPSIKAILPYILAKLYVGFLGLLFYFLYVTLRISLKKLKAQIDTMQILGIHYQTIMFYMKKKLKNLFLTYIIIGLLFILIVYRDNIFEPAFYYPLLVLVSGLLIATSVLSQIAINFSISKN